jgi:glutamate N-acetyltransferase/amino-acid N-acetyltransferase
MEKIASGIAALGGKLDPAGAPDAARAILTTDTRPKTATVDLELAEGTIGISGFAKGAGMIHPNMATMLAVITTDAAIEPRFLATALRAAVARTFNRVSVDGDMSTNDTVLALASGVGVRVHGADLPEFEDALEMVCGALARQIARDGEGATRLVEIEVTGAPDEAAAHAVADAIGRSALVKTAIHGGDPNWGRVLAAAGASGQPLDPDRLTLAFGPAEDPLLLVEEGLPVAHDHAAASALLRGDPVRIRLDLGLGDASATVWTCDMSAEYVAINAHYTT